MDPKKFTTTAQVDQRFVWLDKEIEIAGRKAADMLDPKHEKHANRVRNLRHEKSVLEKRRMFLQTPELAFK
ncbi:MAG: hypothetical protein ABSH16_03455 [Sedimentisphaerales bacterium]|jgi:hypothetical protein